MNQQNPNKTETDELVELFLPFIFIAFFIGLFYFIYYMNRPFLNTVVIYSAWYMLYPITFLMPSEIPILNQISHLNPNNLWLLDDFNILNHTARYYSFLLIPLAFKYVKTLLEKDIHSKYSRNFNMVSLVKNNAQYLPFLKPVIERDKLIIDEATEKGAWALPVKPINWIVKHNLLIDGNNKVIPRKWILDSTGMPICEPDLTPLLAQRIKNRKQINAHIDEIKFKQLIKKQIGPILETDKSKIADSLKDYEVGVLAAALAYGNNDKKKGYNYVALMSESFKEGKWDEKTLSMTDYKLDIGDSREYVKKVLTAKDLPLELELTFKRNGSYFYSWFMSVLENYTLKKGVFNSSLFLFLRPLDRMFFLVLNQTGSQTGWIEALGSWTHYEMEKVAYYTVLDTEYTEKLAFKYLNEYLEGQGWIGWRDSSYIKG